MDDQPSSPLTAIVLSAWATTYGQPDTILTFTHPTTAISPLIVLVYRPHLPREMTVFATAGMAAEPMPARMIDGIERAELTLTRRGAVTPDDEQRIAHQLVSIAQYPWSSPVTLSWNQLLPLDTDFPTFPGCRAVFLSGPLERADPTHIPTRTGPIRVITVIPVTPDESRMAAKPHGGSFIQHLRRGIDIFDARPVDTGS